MLEMFYLKWSGLSSISLVPSRARANHANTFARLARHETSLALGTCARLRESGKSNQIAALLINE